ncbi:unnamed protein product [Rotaria socialis]|uniref:PHD-type domain-containing protein n=1 Tax=Rotaria socialis TaxID=392032 RepID=A0A819C0Y2_9BILA|nr:unnamed protein product [Rotaria socialis]CAF3261470.1 unnamed protein product [Rotaria socialis]CAF3486942.1 unnamed protein product [Rotaria socialis]CAF3811019.1 unnamed protein product [Rotaria socialis]CAF4195676.1 unnamed protein product [Rotaria socialis]
MSLNYARELLKISLSQLCDSIGFDTTSEIALDILVDVCERQFQSLSKQTSNLIQLNNRYQENYFDILSILLENNHENLDQLQDYMFKFQSSTFPKDIIQFPFRKRNQIYLRIPPKDSQEIIQRDQNSSTEYIYDWLPLFPDQETPEQSSLINIDTNIDATIYQDQQKKFDKSDSHHPLTLLSFLSKNGDEPTSVPIGKRPNQSLPSILYRPRRIIEMEVAAAATAAAEKAKKEQLEKETNEKDQQGPPPPLRLTIPKPLVVNDKGPITNKKLSSSILTTTTTTPTIPSSSSSLSTLTLTTTITTTAAVATTIPTTTTTTSTVTNPMAIDGIINKNGINTSLFIGNIPSVNLGNKIIVSPPLNDSNAKQIHSHTNISTNLSESLTNIDKNEETALDLTKKSTLISSPAKLPRLKLNIKNVSNPQITNNASNPQISPPTTKKQIQRPSSSTKQLPNTHEKVNLTIRTSSLPLFGTNEKISMISPPLIVSNENLLNSIETSNNPIYENKKLNDFNQINIRSEQGSTSNEIDRREKKKNKKKKHHNDQHDQKEKKIKKEQENNLVEQQFMTMDIDPIPSSSSSLSTTAAAAATAAATTTTTTTVTTSNTSMTNQSSGGTIRLKIKLGKPSNSANTLETNKSDDQFNSINLHDNQSNAQPESKTSPILLKLQVGPGNNPSISPSISTRPPIISTMNRSASQKRKSGKVKRVPQPTNATITNSSSNIFFHEDNTLSMDDLPLGERTSPNKHVINNIQTNLPQQIISTPIKKKTNANKKKSNNNKRTNNIVGVAVIEERRIDHDSQEKIWICPSCNRPDNGQEAMIACDLCDDWYHWECVGIAEEPPESIPWFCPKCHRSNSSTASAQGIKPSASSKAKRKRASVIYQQQQKQQQYPQQ